MLSCYGVCFGFSAVAASSLPDVVTQLVANVMTTLHSLTATRRGHKRFRHVYEEGSDTSQACLTPLLGQLVDEILQPAAHEVPDIEYKSTGFRDLLKSGFRSVAALGQWWLQVSGGFRSVAAF